MAYLTIKLKNLILKIKKINFEVVGHNLINQCLNICF